MCLLHKDLDWVKFVKDEVTDRDEYLLALESCDTCLLEYMQQLEKVLEQPSPDFADSVMQEIQGMQAKAAKPNSFSPFKPFLHYIVAACLTLFLLEVGAFDWLLKDSLLLTTEPNLFGQFLNQLGELIGTLKINLGG